MSKEFRTIIAATDLSRAAFTAVRRAAFIAREHRAPLELLHVIPASVASGAWNEIRTALGLGEGNFRDEARQRLRDLAGIIEAEFGITAGTHVAEGQPYAEIADRAEAAEADLVVIGVHGSNTMLSPILGSTAHRVLRFAGGPVLVAREALPAAYERVLIATVFSDIVEWAVRYAQRFATRARFTFLHVCEPPYEVPLSRIGLPDGAVADYRSRVQSESRTRLDVFVAALQTRDAEAIVRYGPPALRIWEYAQEMDADLIVLAAESRRTALGSVSMHVVTKAQCDVLLV